MANTQSTSHEITRVVAGILTLPGDNRRQLLQRRPPHKFPDWSLKWSHPGGKIERGESEFDALRRELREELGIPYVEAMSGPIYNRIFTDPILYEVTWLQVSGWDGPISILDKSIGIGWFTADEAETMPTTRGTTDAFRRMEWVAGQARAIKRSNWYE